MTTTTIPKPPEPTRATAVDWTHWVPATVLVWALGYGTLRLVWALGERPELPPTGDDLSAFSDWGIVWLVAATLGLAPMLATDRGPRLFRWIAVGASALTGVGLLAAGCIFLLDIVGLLFPGIGIHTSITAFGTRGACVAGGLLVLVASVGAARRLRQDCLRCGRSAWGTELSARPDPRDGAVLAPRWALIAGYVAVSGCVARLAAQAVVGFGPEGNPYANQSSTSGITFLVAATLAGTLLPLALVHRWGQIWPRWTRWLAGRRVPRWLLVGPAFGVAGGIVIYFAASGIQLLFGETIDTGHSDTFLAVAIVAYLVWGAGLGIAALSYFTRTRPICRRCGA